MGADTMMTLMSSSLFALLTEGEGGTQQIFNSSVINISQH